MKRLRDPIGYMRRIMLLSQIFLVIGHVSNLMKHNDLDALSLMFGCLIGFAFTAFIVFAPLGLDWKDVLLKYQDLVAGVAALIAAGFTIWMINRQIMQAERLAEDNRKRRGYAARSMMPSALSALSNYAQQCSKIPVHVIENSNDDAGLLIAQPVANRPSVPSIPGDGLSVLRDCTECADEDIQMQIADLISHLQVQILAFEVYIRKLILTKNIH